MALQNFTNSTMRSYLESRYNIPNYQRDYSWEENELEDFWNDLMAAKAFPDERHTHFFGQVVIHAENNTGKKYIIDGQQRTITSVIFLRSIRYHLNLLYQSIYESDQDKSRKIDRKINSIDENFIGYDPDKENGEQTFKLQLGKLDNDFFVKNILLGIPSNTKEKKQSWENLRYAYKYFSEKIDVLLKRENPATHEEEALPESEQLEVMSDLLEVFLDRFRVLYMEATDLSEAFTIFETLNARGKDLETADLLKNYLLSKSSDPDKALEKWNEMVKNLSNYDVTKYIRYYWNSNHDFTRDKGLYREITKKVRTPREALCLLEDLSALSIAFNDLTYRDAPKYFTADEDTGTVLKSLKVLKASTFYPILLAMQQTKGDLNKEESALAVLKALEVLIFRNFTIGGQTANSAEVKLASIAKSIYDGALTTVQEIIKEISAMTIGDSQFKEDFKVWRGSSSTKDTVRYILRKIHEHHDSETKINTDTAEVHIEHIMPEDNSIWGVEESLHEEYLWRLGNLCLLSGAINISISNKSFEDKKSRYADSKIEPNKDISAYDKWDNETIEDRQGKLSDDALNIWKF